MITVVQGRNITWILFLSTKCNFLWALALKWLINDYCAEDTVQYFNWLRCCPNRPKFWTVHRNNVFLLPLQHSTGRRNYYTVLWTNWCESVVPCLYYKTNHSQLFSPQIRRSLAVILCFINLLAYLFTYLLTFNKSCWQSEKSVFLQWSKCNDNIVQLLFVNVVCAYFLFLLCVFLVFSFSFRLLFVIWACSCLK